MKDRSLFKRIATITAILVAPVTVASTVTLLISVNFNSEFMSHPENLITIGAPASETFRWGTILELGSTLLLIPTALYLWYWLRPRNQKLVTLYTVFGMTSLLLAIAGELLRANFYPPLMSAYSDVSEIQKDLLMVIFQGVTNLNFEGLWALELIFWGIWWLGIGFLLRSDRHILGLITMILGILFFIAGAGWLLRVGPLARLENLYFFVPIWTVWLGLVIWRNDEVSSYSIPTSTNA